MDELTVTNIDANMGQTGFICILEEHHITGLKICFGNGLALGIHGSLGAADIDAVAAKHIVNKTRHFRIF